MDKVRGCQWLELRRKQTGFVAETWQGWSGGAPLERVAKKHIPEEAQGSTIDQSSNLHPGGQSRDLATDCRRMSTTENTGVRFTPTYFKKKMKGGWGERGEMRWGKGQGRTEGLHQSG